MPFEIKEALTDEEILSCWDVVQILRPHVELENYLEQIKLQQTQGFHLMYVEDPQTQKAVSFMGFRSLSMLYYGKALYIEDLATMPEVRGQGMAGALLNYFFEYAEDNGYDKVSVDSVVTRHTAHRFYLNQGFDITGHHFEMHNVQAKKEARRAKRKQ